MGGCRWCWGGRGQAERASPWWAGVRGSLPHQILRREEIPLTSRARGGEEHATLHGGCPRPTRSADAAPSVQSHRWLPRRRRPGVTGGSVRVPPPPPTTPIGQPPQLGTPKFVPAQRHPLRTAERTRNARNRPRVAARVPADDVRRWLRPLLAAGHAASCFRAAGPDAAVRRLPPRRRRRSPRCFRHRAVGACQRVPCVRPVARRYRHSPRWRRAGGDASAD